MLQFVHQCSYWLRKLVEAVRLAKFSTASLECCNEDCRSGFAIDSRSKIGTLGHQGCAERGCDS